MYGGLFCAPSDNPIQALPLYAKFPVTVMCKRKEHRTPRELTMRLEKARPYACELLLHSSIFRVVDVKRRKGLHKTVLIAKIPRLPNFLSALNGSRLKS